MKKSIKSVWQFAVEGFWTKQALPLLTLLLLLTALVSCSGEDGANGVKGADGTSCEIKTSAGYGNDFEIFCGGKHVGYLNNGKAGEQGTQGEQGIPGIQGEKGEQGEAGEQGTQGEQGVPGIQGEKGEQGEAGEQGTQGEQGIPGIQGEKGDKGETGDKGATGKDGTSCMVIPTEVSVHPESLGHDFEIICGEEHVGFLDNGKPEEQGNQGYPYTGCTVALSDNLELGDLKITCGENSSYLKHGKNGAQGEKGEKGDKGLDGTSCDVDDVGAYFVMKCGGVEKAKWAKAMCGKQAYNNEEFVCDNGIPSGSLEYQGQTYKTVMIGNQIWMAENLNYKLVPGNNSCYNNDDEYCAVWGKLYDWAAATADICPQGWHLPNNNDWNELFYFVDGYTGTSTSYNSLTVGSKLKLAGTAFWYFSNNGTTDEYGFSALPSGYYNTESFTNGTNCGFWWSATEENKNKAYRIGICDLNDGIILDTHPKNEWFSVRCVKD